MNFYEIISFVATTTTNSADIIIQTTNRPSLLSGIISALIGAISSIIIFTLTCVKDFSVTKKEVRKERIEKLYFVFYRNYIDLHLYNVNFMELHPSNCCEIDDLLYKNIYLANTKTQILFYEFHKLFVEQKNITEINKRFQAVEKALLQEYKLLCKKLRYPEPAKVH